MATRQYNPAMVDKPYPSDAAEKFIVRFPPGMRERVAESAKRNGRSMNAEVVHILQDHFGRQVAVLEDAAMQSQSRENFAAPQRDTSAVLSPEQAAVVEAAAREFAETIRAEIVLRAPSFQMSIEASAEEPAQPSSARPYTPGGPLPSPPATRYRRTRK